MHLVGEMLDQGVCRKQGSVVSGVMRLACKSTGKGVQVKSGCCSSRDWK